MLLLVVTSPAVWAGSSWSTFWTAVGAIGTTGALVAAAVALIRDSRDARRRRAIEEVQEVVDRARWTVTLDRETRLHAYRDLFVAQDDRLSTLWAHQRSGQASEASSGGDGDVAKQLERARQKAWAALAMIRMVSPPEVVDAADKYVDAVNREMRAKTTEQRDKCTVLRKQAFAAFSNATRAEYESGLGAAVAIPEQSDGGDPARST